MITLEQARQELPKNYQISDKELSSVLADLYGIADIAIDQVLINNEKGHERK